jgi:FemAB-related protein (PEP-CTERM system-associated)
MSIQVRAYDGSAGAWDAFLASVPGTTHAHRYGWKSVIERAFGHDCPYLAAWDGDRLVGALPLARVRSLLFGRYVVSLPYLNYGGPVGSDDAVRALAARAVEIAGGDRAKLLELRGRQALPLDLPVSHRKITVVLDVPARVETLWEGLKAKVRSQVRRPQKEGVRVVFGADQLAPFYDVFATHMRDLGTPVLPRSFFQAAAEELGDDFWVACAHYQGRAVAGGCGVRWGGEFEITWASALQRYNAIAPNMLVYWSFLERCVETGVGLFNFGRCTPGSGTHRFKQQWGGRDEPLWWYQSSRRGVAATPSPDAAAYSWGPRIWRRLPVGLASRLGPMVVRGIP